MAAANPADAAESEASGDGGDEAGEDGERDERDEKQGEACDEGRSCSLQYGMDDGDKCSDENH